MMLRILGTTVLLTSMLPACMAQPGGRSNGGRSGSSLPRVGTQLPDVSAFDEDGREFSLSELRGEYSVLVFGCLT